MEITLYKNSSNEREIVKTLDVVTKKTYLTSYLKFPTDLLNPTIRINEQTSSGIEDYNYAYIKEFGRYYFITNITFFNTETFDIYLTVDVMMSWYESFKTDVMLIARCEDSDYYNENIIDNMCGFQQQVNITNIAITKLVDDDEFSWSTPISNYLCLIVSILKDAITLEQLPATNVNIPSITRQSHGSQASIMPYVTVYDNVKNLCTYLMSHESEASFVYKILAMPFNIERLKDENDQYVTSGTQINFGAGLPVSVGTYPYYFPKYNMIRLKIAEFTFNDTLLGSSNIEMWLKRSPYSKYELYVPFYGYVELNFDMCYGQTLKLYYFVNTNNGETYAVLTRSSDNRNVWSDNVKLGVEVPISASNANQNDQIRKSSAISTSVKTVVGVGSSILGAALTATGYGAGIGIGLMAGGVGTVASSVTDSVKTAMTTFDYNKITNMDANMSCINGLKPFIKVQRMVPEVDYASASFKHLKGMPCNEAVQLNAMGGYIKVEQCKITCGTLKEQQEIDRRLKEGVYL